jgi:hypothetical protein
VITLSCVVLGACGSDKSTGPANGTADPEKAVCCGSRRMAWFRDGSKVAMGGTDVTRWLYNQGSATADRPGDLGYFIGYRIAEAYYARTSDKRLALKAIIEVSNATEFLAQSGYDP